MKKVSMSVMMVIIISLIAGAVFAKLPPPNPNQINALYIYSQKTLINMITKEKHLMPEKPCAGQEFYLIYVDSQATRPQDGVQIIKKKTDYLGLIYSKDVGNVGTAKLKGVANKYPEIKDSAEYSGLKYEVWVYWPVDTHPKYLLGAANIAGTQKKIGRFTDPMQPTPIDNDGSLDPNLNKGSQ